MNLFAETLWQWAREETDLAVSLPSRLANGGRYASNVDPIRGEVARLCAALYRRVAAGEEVETVFAELCAQARAAARRYNERQRANFGGTTDWRSGYAGYYGEDEAETKLRHARGLVLALAKQLQEVAA